MLYSQIDNKCKQKYIYLNGLRIAFDGKRVWSYDNEFAKNVVKQSI